MEEELRALETEEPLPPLEGWRGYIDAARPDAPLSAEDIATLIPADGVVAGESGHCFGPYRQGMLASLPEVPLPPARPGLVRLERTEEGIRRVGYYRFHRGSWVAVQTIRDLKDALEEPPPQLPVDVSPAQQQFEMDLGRAPPGA